jgi:para-aminobenzoate synthetase/4-amino-4-deoxychorismate lyase
LRRHKTTARAVYDRALAGVRDRPEIFDVIFCNMRGELAEGARSTLFVRLDGQWLTPPLAAGALPGVLRAERLASGWAREACLRPADLLRAEAIECGNALRGGVPVRLLPGRLRAS